MAIKKNTPVPEIVSAYVSNDSSLGTEVNGIAVDKNGEKHSIYGLFDFKSTVENPILKSLRVSDSKGQPLRDVDVRKFKWNKAVVEAWKICIEQRFRMYP